MASKWRFKAEVLPNSKEALSKFKGGNGSLQGSLQKALLTSASLKQSTENEKRLEVK